MSSREGCKKKPLKAPEKESKEMDDYDFFVRIVHIRKCFTQKGNIFIIEEFNPKTRQVIQRKYKSPLADQICYSVLCVFSYVAAGTDKMGKTKKPVPIPHLATGTKPVEAPKEQVVHPPTAAIQPPPPSESGSVTPVGGPPKYPPPALPPGVAPPARPPGVIKTLPVQLSTTTPPSARPPPVPTRNITARQISVTQPPPQPPPRPK